jgi:hypothetical protein
VAFSLNPGWSWITLKMLRLGSKCCKRQAWRQYLFQAPSVFDSLPDIDIDGQ